MKIGISFDGFIPFPDSLAIAREAEAMGASSLWMAEHLGYRDPLGSCMAFAMATSRCSMARKMWWSPDLGDPGNHCDRR